DRGQRTRRRVLDAARKVLVRRGYQAVRIEEITKLAQVGYGTFYKYFRNKQDVVETVMEEVYGQLQYAGLSSQVESTHLEHQIRRLITNYLETYYKNREILLALQPVGMLSQRIRKFLTEIRERDVEWMIRGFEGLNSQGCMIAGNLEVLSLAMLHSVDTVAQEWITRRPHLQLEELAETLSEIWFRAMSPPRPAGTHTQS
ncbi:MAG TPA: TetR/AcrR family transcriptional regulator, partial [Acidobacteriota bacterium]|nr:TetR/AcrR family transcriptional regulator [Acidobacteriota bacterium]